MSPIALSIEVCVASFVALIWMLRSDRVSLGLPIAYLALLLLNHLPGALGHLYDEGGYLTDPLYTEVGLRFTTMGVVCFVIGIWLARSSIPAARIQHYENDSKFWMFCLLGGWFFVYGLAPLQGIPSLGAAIQQGGGIWIFGVLLGLRYAVQNHDWKGVTFWTIALSVYPILMLLVAGFLSYGTGTTMVAISALAVSTRKWLRLVIAVPLIGYLGLTVFANYIENRTEMRVSVATSAPFEERIAPLFQNAKWFDLTDPLILVGLDLRLNQNYFVGLGAERIANGDTQYLYGRSVWEAMLSIIPRALWPDKSVFGGSPEIVTQATGLALDPNTSWGVGQVMEFQLNFGTPGVILGFLALGWLLGTIDRKAALAEARKDYGRAIMFFLPGVALIQPLGSLVELTGGAVAALLGGYIWRWIWRRWGRQRDNVPQATASQAHI